MKSSHIWSIETLLKNFLLIDAYILLKSLAMHEDQVTIVGIGQMTLRQFIEMNNLAACKLDACGWRFYFIGGPVGEYYITSVKHYIVDRVLQAIIAYGPVKVSKVFDEIKCLTA